MSDKEREALVAMFPWIKDFDAVLNDATTFREALARCRALPIRRIVDGRHKLNSKTTRKSMSDYVAI